MGDEKNQIFEVQYNVPISEKVIYNNDFIIKGTAISATLTGNNHLFLEEELMKSSASLMGVPLLIDHKNEVSAIKGRVIKSGYDSMKHLIPFEAKVMDKEMQAMIEDKRLNSVSVGAVVGSIEEGPDGVLIPRGIVFKELSLVAVPADSNATFTSSLQEAYQKSKPKKVEIKKEEEVDEEDLPEEISNSQSNDKIIIERRNEMEEQKIEQKSENIALSEANLKLAEANKMIAEYKAKERKALEEKYVSACKSKDVKSLDVSKLDDAAVSMLIEQISSIKIAAKVETKAEEKEVFGTKKIVAEHGSLRGGAFTVMY